MSLKWWFFFCLTFAIYIMVGVWAERGWGWAGIIGILGLGVHIYSHVITEAELAQRAKEGDPA